MVDPGINWDAPKSAQHYTFADLERPSPAWRDKIFTLRADGFESLIGDRWYARLDVIAAGDFEKTGKQQLLIVFFEPALDGTLFSRRPLILIRERAGGPISAHRPELRQPATAQH